MPVWQRHSDNACAAEAVPVQQELTATGDSHGNSHSLYPIQVRKHCVFLLCFGTCNQYMFENSALYSDVLDPAPHRGSKTYHNHSISFMKTLHNFKEMDSLGDHYICCVWFRSRSPGPTPEPRGSGVGPRDRLQNQMVLDSVPVNP